MISHFFFFKVSNLVRVPSFELTFPRRPVERGSISKGASELLSNEVDRNKWNKGAMLHRTQNKRKAKKLFTNLPELVNASGERNYKP